MSTTYNLPKKLQIKANFGSAFRAPNFEELFYYFVDANHNVQGNPNLNPEDGISIFLNVDKTIPVKEQGFFKTSFTTYYINITDKIEQTIAEDNEDVQYSYFNIDEAKTIGFSLNQSLQYNNWQFNLGATYMGESSSIIELTENLDEYLWTFNLNTNLSYTIPRIKTTISALLKYNGKSQLYLEDSSSNIMVRQTDAFTWLNTSIRTQLTKKFSIVVRG